MHLSHSHDTLLECNRQAKKQAARGADRMEGVKEPS